MLGTPLSRINARTALLDGAQSVMNDVRANHLGDMRNPDTKIDTAGHALHHTIEIAANMAGKFF